MHNRSKKNSNNESTYWETTVEMAAPVTPKRKVYISKGNKNTADKFPIPANQSPTSINKIEKQKN
jgi:hypothetical protein